MAHSIEPKTTDLSRLITAALRDSASLWRRKSLQRLTEIVALQARVEIPRIQKALRRLYPQLTLSGLSMAGQPHHQINCDLLFLSGADVYIGKSTNPALQAVLSEMGHLRDEAFVRYDRSK